MATTPDDDGPTISLPPNFHFSPADRRLKTPSGPGSDNDRPPLGVLDHFTGSFTGQGFNTIFRPHSDSDPQTTGDNILELNLTVETIDFSRDLGDVPNRGLGAQPDISLNGVPYIQRVRDMTDISTGTRFTDPTKGVDIHFEPGLWMHVPATTSGKFPASGSVTAYACSAPLLCPNGWQCLPYDEYTRHDLPRENRFVHK